MASALSLTNKSFLFSLTCKTCHRRFLLTIIAAGVLDHRRSSSLSRFWASSVRVQHQRKVRVSLMVSLVTDLLVILTSSFPPPWLRQPCCSCWSSRLTSSFPSTTQWICNCKTPDTTLSSRTSNSHRFLCHCLCNVAFGNNGSFNYYYYYLHTVCVYLYTFFLAYILRVKHLHAICVYLYAVSSQIKVFFCAYI